MTAAKKTVLTIYLICVVLCCVLILCCMFGALNTHLIADVVNTFLFGSLGFKVLYAIIFTFIIIISLFLLCFDFKKPIEKTVNIATFDDGSVLISVKAIEELVGKYLSLDNSIKENHSRITTNGDSISIKIDIAAYSETIIPDVTKNLSGGLKEFIETQTGIKVQDVEVLVQNIISSSNNLKNSNGANVR